MATSSEISVAVPVELLDVVYEAVENGEYSSSSDVVRDALRDWVRSRHLSAEEVKHLSGLWQEAIERGGPGVAADEVFDRLEQKYQAMADGVVASSSR